MKRKHTIFNEGRNQEINIPLVADRIGVISEDLSRSLATLEQYNPRQINFSRFYEILHDISPRVFDLNHSVIFDEDVENFVMSHSQMSNEQVHEWFMDYKKRSKYYNHLKDAADKYNFWGHKTGVLEIEDIGEEIKLKVDHAEYADPTYDSTFKMLFASEEHKNLLIDFANSLLGFTGGEKIVEVSLEREETPPFGKYGINSAVDVLCSTANGKTIALEMQRKHEDYFLSRTQYYMSKLFVTSMQKGFSDQYHKMIDKVYMIIIGKDAIFPKEMGLDDQYEFTVTPTIEELRQPVPDNKMYWKFFELKRFEKLCNNEEIGVEQSSSKYNIQKWLRFLLECGKKTEESIPDDIPEIIKEAYKVMKTANMNPQDYSRYQDEQVHEHFERLERESSIRKAEKAIKKAQSEGLAEGLAEGLSKGISVALKYAPDANLQEDFHITQEQENKIKQLEQKPPAPSDIEEILLSNWHIESLDHQQNTELLGTDDSHAVHDA